MDWLVDFMRFEKQKREADEVIVSLGSSQIIRPPLCHITLHPLRRGEEMSLQM